MQVPEGMAAKVQAAMGDRSVSIQSFEERFPGVYIRRKKKRDMDRCLSSTSMDSWGSALETEEMSWLMANVSPPASPTKAHPGATSAPKVDRMIPVISMDCLDEANDPVVMNDWHPNVQAVKPPSRGASKPFVVPGAALGPLFNQVNSGDGAATAQPQRKARIVPGPPTAIDVSQPSTSSSSNAGTPSYSSQSSAPSQPRDPDYTSASPFPPALIPKPAPPSRRCQMVEPHPHHLHTQPAPHHPPSALWDQNHQVPRHSHHHHVADQPAHASRQGRTEPAWPQGGAAHGMPGHSIAPASPALHPTLPPDGRLQRAAPHPNPFGPEPAAERPQPSRSTAGRGKGGRGNSSHPTTVSLDDATAPPAGDAAAAAAYMAAAAMAGKGGNKDFNFTDVFLAYMTAAKQNPEGSAAAEALAQQLAQHQQTMPRRPPGPEDLEKSAVDPRKYKTRMCRNWETKGHCPYEHTCCFAHGPDELRDLTTNHKLLASIGYFSNIILLSMTNGTKPALPPHCLYQQPQMLAPPETPEELKRATQTLPDGVHFPFQDPMPAALRGLKKEARAKHSKPAREDPQGPPGADDGSKKRIRRRRRRGKGDAEYQESATGEGMSDNGDDVAA